MHKAVLYLFFPCKFRNLSSFLVDSNRFSINLCVTGVLWTCLEGGAATYCIMSLVYI